MLSYSQGSGKLPISEVSFWKKALGFDLKSITSADSYFSIFLIYFFFLRAGGASSYLL
jgi:hypothetical protein